LKKKNKIIIEIMVSELNTLLCNKFHHHHHMSLSNVCFCIGLGSQGVRTSQRLRLKKPPGEESWETLPEDKKTN